MQRTQFIIIFTSLILSAFAQAQAPAATSPPVAPPGVDQGMTPQSMDVDSTNQVGDADPLDVLEPKTHEAIPPEPSVPQFTEIPDPEASPSVGTTDAAPPAPEMVDPAKAADANAAPNSGVAEKKSSKRARKSIAEKKSSKKKSKKNKLNVDETSGVVSNDPDLGREARFHNIYKKYNEQPTSDEAWEQAASSRKAEVYKVQKGDTLWALSQTFFADNNYWPKIWSLNVGAIGNPHEIDPNMAIQFFPGTMSEAPTLGVLENGEPPHGEAVIAANAPAEVVEGDVALPKHRRRAPLLQELPDSLPAYRQKTMATLNPGLELPNMHSQYVRSPEFLSYYASDTSINSVGSVVETEMGMNTAAEYQYVIVQINVPLNGAKSVVAMKELTTLQDPDSPRANTRIIEVQGELEIFEKVNDAKNLYRAMVRKTIQPIDVGARLVLGPIPTFDPTPTALDYSVHAKIVGGEYDNRRKQYQSNMIVFLNAGSSQGLRDGQSLPIYSNIRNRNLGSQARMNDRPIGTVKVIRAVGGFATAYITGASDDIFVGDHVGARNLLSASNGLDLGNNTDINRAPPTDLVPTEDSKDASAKDGDFELDN